jgi:hypothetical protein
MSLCPACRLAAIAKPTPKTGVADSSRDGAIKWVLTDICALTFCKYSKMKVKMERIGFCGFITA